MPKRDHEPVFLDPSRGLWARGDNLAPPVGYLSKAKNLVYSVPGVLDSDGLIINNLKARVREDFTSIQNLQANPVRFYIYTKSTGNRIIFLDSSGNIWDAAAGTIILTRSTSDFHGITLNDRFFFTLHDRTTGLSGEVVYIYDPSLSATARKAAGDPVTGTFTIAASSVAGSIEPGTHIVAISYKTDTGFITKPALHIAYTAPTPRKKLNLSLIPVGPSHIVSRIIWMSQLQLNFDGNLTGPELFKVYEIENNTSTVLNDTVDAFDGNLIDSADPYVDTLNEIPAGTFLTDFDGSLAVCGSFDSPHTLRISNPNEPENIDGVDGIREIVKGTGGGIRTTRSLRGNLFWWKKNMTGVLRPTAENTPSEWPYDVIDWSTGSEVYGVSESINLPNVFFDTYLVANQSGLLPFNGTYTDPLRPLTDVISPLWENAVFLNNFDTVMVRVDPINYRIYVLIKDSASVTRWFMGDFSDGLNYESIKWSLWDFVYSATLFKNMIDMHVLVNPAVNKNGVTLLAIAENDAGLRESVSNTFSAGADFDGDIEAQFGFKISDPEFRDIHLQSVRALLSASEENSIGEYKMQVMDKIYTLRPEIADAVVEEFPNVQNRVLEAIFTAKSADLCVLSVIFYIKPIYLERSNI